jgi:hypothetical protein
MAIATPGSPTVSYVETNKRVLVIFCGIERLKTAG